MQQEFSCDPERDAEDASRGRIPMMPQGHYKPYPPPPKPKQSPLAGVKSAFKKAKEAFQTGKGQFAEGEDEELKKLGESLEKMNFDEEPAELEDSQESDNSEEKKEENEHMEQIQAILPQFNEEQLDLVLETLNAILEGKEPQIEMGEKKMPMDQSRAKKNPNQNYPASFSEKSKARVPKWLEQHFSEMQRSEKAIKETVSAIEKKLSAIDSKEKSKESYAKFQEELNVALKGHPHRESLTESFTQTFSESGEKVARETMKRTLEITSKVPVQPVAKKLPRKLTESFSEAASQRDIPELKKYAGNVDHLQTAMKYAEIWQSRSENTMSFGEYIDKGVKAEFAELRGDVRTATKTFNENKK